MEGGRNGMSTISVAAFPRDAWPDARWRCLLLALEELVPIVEIDEVTIFCSRIIVVLSLKGEP